MTPNAMVSVQGTGSTELLSTYLRLVRRAIRLAAVSDGLLRWLIVLAVVATVIVGIDYRFEPAVEVRVTLRAIAAVAALASFGWLVLARCWAAIPDRSLALWIERRQPIFAHQLVTAVERRHDPAGASPALLRQLEAESLRLACQVPPQQRVSWQALVRPAVMALASVSAIVVWGILAHSASAVAFDRLLALGDARYPTRTRLRVVGIESTAVRVARGGSFAIQVHADGVLPERATIRYRSPGQWLWRQSPMARSDAGNFHHVFANVLDPMELDVLGGDDHTDRLLVTPVAPPRIIHVVADVSPPNYTGLEPSTSPAMGPVDVPAGSTVVLQCTTNKDVHVAQCAAGDDQLAVATTSPRSFSLALRADQTTTVRLGFTDTDRVSVDPPLGVTIQARPDLPPVMRVRVEGVGRRIASHATIPFACDIEDDYQLASLRAEIEVAESAVAPVSIELAGSLGRLWTDRVEIDAGEILAPAFAGTRIQVRLVAADDRGDRPMQESRTEWFRFEIVPPEDLLHEWSVREVGIRQRLEQVVDELRIAGDDLPVSSKEANERGQANRARYALTAGKARNDAVDQLAQLERIRDELYWNRIGPADLSDRLEARVIEPLRGVVEVGFIELRHALDRLKDSSADRAVEQDVRIAHDRLLHGLQGVIEGMVQRESLAELVRRLEGLIDAQQRLAEDARQARKRRVLDLLKPAGE